MSAIELWLMELLLEHDVAMLRVEAEAKAKVLALMILMQKDVVSLLAGSPELTALGKAGKNALLRESNDLITKYYGKAALEVDLAGVAEVEALGVKQALGAVVDRAAGELGAEVRIGVQLPTENYLRTLASDAAVQGAPARAWWARQAQDTVFKLANEIRIGAAQGETNAQIIKRVVGQDAVVAKAPAAPGVVPAIEPSIPGVMPLARKNAAAIVQTSMQSVAAEARRKTFQANADITNGIMQVSTLDGHTSLTCIAYSGAQWDLDYEPINGNDLPYNGGVPRHWNAVASGSMIETSKGSVRIEDIAVGDLVTTHKGRLQAVTATMSKPCDSGAIRIIDMGASGVLRVTDEHPVLTAGRGWVRADAIRRGDQLFQYPAKPVPVGALKVVVGATDDYPPCFRETEVFTSVTVKAAVVRLPVKLDNDLVSREREITDVARENVLADEVNAGSGQDGGELLLTLRRVGQLPCLGGYRRAVARLRKMYRVAGDHARRMVGVIGMRFFGLPECPMIFASHQAGCLQRSHVDLGGCSLAPNRDAVLFAPAGNEAVAQAKFALDFAGGLIIDDVLLMDESGKGGAVGRIDHWLLSTVEDITIVAHSGAVYNIAVQEDETYISDGFVVHNCRSSEIAIMKTLREMGIDMDEPDPGQRASSDGPVSAKMTFAEFLTKKGEAYQNEVLGPGRAELFRAGKLTPRDLVDMRGQPLKLDDLRAKYADARPFRAPSGQFTIYDPGYARVAADVSTPARAAAVKLEGQIRRDGRETGAFFAKDGSMLLKRSGEPDRVTYTAGELKSMHGTLFTHNHPGGSTFSVADVQNARFGGLNELRAVSPDYRHIMTAEKGWPSEATIQRVFDREAIAARRDVDTMVKSGELSAKYATTEIYHLTWVRAAPKLGLTYLREAS